MKGLTSFQIEEIKKRFSNESTLIISKELNLSISKVNYWGAKFGLKKSETQITSTRWKKGDTFGFEHRFKKGNVPANKGKKMPLYVRLKAEKTMFQKGNKPHNTKPVGTINIRYDKTGIPYQYIKISDANWRLLQRHIWEKENGPIPKGFRIHFKDGNSLNCDLENLELLSPDEAMQRNTIMRFPPELRETIKLNKKLIKKIESYGKK